MVTEATGNIEKETMGNVNLALNIQLNILEPTKTQKSNQTSVKQYKTYVVGCGGFCVVATVCPNGVKIQTKSNQHLSNICSKSMKIWSKGVLEHFGTQIAPRSAQGRGCFFFLSLLWVCGSWVVGRWWCVVRCVLCSRFVKMNQNLTELDSNL